MVPRRQALEDVICCCGSLAVRLMPAPAVRVPYAELRTTGSRASRKFKPPGLVDFEPLADGHSYKEWCDKERVKTRHMVHQMLRDRGKL